MFIMDALRLCAILAAVYELRISVRMLTSGHPALISGRLFAYFGIGTSLFCILIGMAVLRQSKDSLVVVTDFARIIMIASGWGIAYVTFLVRTLMRVENPKISGFAYALMTISVFVLAYLDHRYLIT